jgi:hypothetical protein
VGGLEQKKNKKRREERKVELHNLEVVFAKKKPLSKANGNLKKSTRLFEGLDFLFFCFFLSSFLLCNFNPFFTFLV